MDGMRVFACLRPPAAALDHLQHALDGVAPVPTDGGPPPLRWVPPEQRHVTLAFYGEVPEGALDELTDALAAVAARTPPLRVQLAGAGVFSGATLWMGVRAVDDERALLRLMADCEAAGEEISRMEPRDRRRAHLTVARLSARRQRDRADQRRRQGGRHADARAVRRAALPGVDLPGISHALSVYRGPVWEAREIELVHSRLGAGRGGGAHHEVLVALPLGEPVTAGET